MIGVGITQRMMTAAGTAERRTALDVRWPAFLARCGLAAVPLPNDPALAVETADALALGGLVLSGGEDLARYGGGVRERDETERRLLEWALRDGRPVLGVCRGMQLIADYYGAGLHPVDGHVAVRHEVVFDGSVRTVGCFHRWAADRVPEPLEVTGRRGPVVEAVRLKGGNVQGIMWHPERDEQPQQADVDLFRSLFAGALCAR
ncbi:gamma-glutamyl-gamma-aminobutyrate hydrolase family protein [Kitasatospora sp. NPDC058063]|uniref:gamma-glutamyl-gamma-aminobutyrate hydrolase family protein n=1 Tax=unclassified Kitasatospora TaxID=2633591 RepID=UPI0036D90AAC